MKKKTAYILLVSWVLFATSFLMIGMAFGWYADVLDLGSGTISVGDLRYSETGAFISNSQIIYPGEELIDTSISITNTSPIESQMRLKIEYTKVTRPVDVLVIETATYANAAGDHINVTFDDTFVYSDGYWYYNATDAVISANSGLINIISSIYYDGEETGNDYAGQAVNVSVTIQVKQSDNVTWSELTSYDFSTGYPA